MKKFFPYLTGLRREVFWTCILMFAACVLYLIAALVAAVAENNFASAMFAFCITLIIPFAVLVFTVSVSAFAGASMLASGLASAGICFIFAGVPDITVAFAILTLGMALVGSGFLKQQYNIGFIKSFLLFLSHSVIFGFSAYSGVNYIIALACIYATGIIYFFVLNKRLVAYEKALIS